MPISFSGAASLAGRSVSRSLPRGATGQTTADSRVLRKLSWNSSRRALGRLQARCAPDPCGSPPLPLLAPMAKPIAAEPIAAEPIVAEPIAAEPIAEPTAAPERAWRAPPDACPPLDPAGPQTPPASHPPWALLPWRQPSWQRQVGHLSPQPLSGSHHSVSWALVELTRLAEDLASSPAATPPSNAALRDETSHWPDSADLVGPGADVGARAFAGWLAWTSSPWERRANHRSVQTPTAAHRDGLPRASASLACVRNQPDTSAREAADWQLLGALADRRLPWDGRADLLDPARLAARRLRPRACWYRLESSVAHSTR
eukprot:scaffold1509_cov240-Pinguiococcus_pyrenoidosus.AAC.41